MTYSGIPRACAKTDTIVAYTQTADTVLMTTKSTNALATKNIPNLAKISLAKLKRIA